MDRNSDEKFQCSHHKDENKIRVQRRPKHNFIWFGGDAHGNIDRFNNTPQIRCEKLFPETKLDWDIDRETPNNSYILGEKDISDSDVSSTGEQNIENKGDGSEPSNIRLTVDASTSTDNPFLFILDEQPIAFVLEDANDDNSILVDSEPKTPEKRRSNPIFLNGISRITDAPQRNRGLWRK